MLPPPLKLFFVLAVSCGTAFAQQAQEQKTGNGAQRTSVETNPVPARPAVTLAPADFGTLSNTLLIGNFGDGKIIGYDPNSGQFMGTLGSASGPFAAPGLWGVGFGNDAASQPHNTLFFAAGPNNQANGVYGRIDLP